MKRKKMKKGTIKYALSITKYVSCRCMSSVEFESESPNKNRPISNEPSPAKMNQPISFKICLLYSCIVYG